MSASPVEPDAVVDGLAVYRIGKGAPVMLFPYPHAMTVASMARSSLADVLADIGRCVLTFDPPGAYASSRDAACTLEEMLECALTTLDHFGVGDPVDVAGHSMGAFCALAFAVDHPARTRRLMLVGATSGFPAIMRWGIPHNWRWWRDPEWWEAVWLGTRVMLGRDNLAVHKRLSNVVARASFVDTTRAPVWAVRPGDRSRSAPARIAWQRNVRRYDLRPRLGEVTAPALLLYGRSDPQTPLVMAEELLTLLPAGLRVFEQSGHSPFEEERELFVRAAREFLA